MNRKEFLKNSLIMGGGAMLSDNSPFTTSLNEEGMDKLTDETGKSVLQPLPYSENFLEPNMDAETMHLHYTFHHGGAVKGANHDLEMIPKPITFCHGKGQI